MECLLRASRSARIILPLLLSNFLIGLVAFLFLALAVSWHSLPSLFWSYGVIKLPDNLGCWTLNLIIDISPVIPALLSDAVGFLVIPVFYSVTQHKTATVFGREHRSILYSFKFAWKFLSFSNVLKTFFLHFVLFFVFSFLHVF